MPQQVVQHRQDMNGVTDLSNTAQQRPSRREHRNQLGSNPGTQYTRMSIPRQPAHIRQQNRVYRPHPSILPSNLPTSDFRFREHPGIIRADLIIQANINNNGRTIGVSSKEIWDMLSTVTPVKTERL